MCFFFVEYGLYTVLSRRLRASNMHVFAMLFEKPSCKVFLVHQPFKTHELLRFSDPAATDWQAKATVDSMGALRAF